ncbi:PAS domain S-box protein [Alkalilimnicola sp. S0819]|uniref:PAS domain S-box protein n=1 Tax=Alkalilimnicola sp. S0819 TaxID=2613922 RepID=UPI0012626A7B|nr:PAS domain S-box protein [Alkalilimnicola sp. S0819]KAB7624010.1 PAS domain S-box protein [Alkalilimnicola sp. S0819]MPQ16618.1 PAS domain S-box protein [Alkalilimnicola sp. S0819]
MTSARPRLRSHAQQWLTLLLGLVVTMALVALSHHWNQQRWQARLAQVAAERSYLLQNGMQRALDLTLHANALVAASDKVTRRERYTFFRMMLSTYPEVHNILWLKRVAAAQREAFVREQRAEDPDFRVWERAAQGRRATTPGITTYVTTETGLPGTLETMRGFSPGGEYDENAEALTRAVAERRTVLGPPVSLVSDTRITGVVAFMPIPRNSLSEDDVLGVIALVFDLQRTFLTIFGPDMAQGQTPLRIEDVSGETPILLYSSHADGAALPPVAHQETLELGGRQWRISFMPQPAGIPASGFAALLCGLLLTTLAVARLRHLQQRADLVAAEVAVRTRELAESNAALNHSLSEKQQALEELAVSEARYRLLADHASDLITQATPENAVFEYVSPASRRLLGHEPEALIGRSAYELFHPGDVYRIRLAHEEALRAPGVYALNHRMRHAAGHYVWLETTHRIIADERGRPTAIVSVIRDASDHSAPRQALREREALFRGVFEEAPGGMVLFDTRRRLLRVNQAFCELVGYSRDELRHLSLDDITHPGDWQTTPGCMQKLIGADAKHCSYEQRYLNKRGETRWTRVQLSLVRDNQGEPLYFIAQKQDISGEREQSAQV